MLDAATEYAIVLVQHVLGVISIVFNGAILLLILKDDDKRNMTYRKYLCSLQIFSLACDTFSDFYAPILLSHKALVYSDSLLARLIPVSDFWVIASLIYCEVFISYFACVFYRRGVVISSAARFNFFGRKRVILFSSLQVHLFVSVLGTHHFLRKSLEYSERMLPEELHWVRNKTTHVYLRMDDNLFYASCVADQFATVQFFAIFAMLRQLITEVKRSTRKASVATRRFQRLAVRSLILQGAVPGLVFLIPSFLNTCLQVLPTVFELSAKFDRFASVLSPCLWVVMTQHTFANSLTMLYCSPSYRRKIMAIFQSLKLKYCTVQVSPMQSDQMFASITQK